MTTPNLVPRADNEGQLGTTDKAWALSVFRGGMKTGASGSEKTIKATGTTNTDFMVSQGATTGADATLSVERGSTGNDAQLWWDEDPGVWKFGVVGTMKEIADKAELYKIKADSGDTSPAYLGSKIDTDQLQITAGDLLQIKDIYVTLSGAQEVAGAKDFSGGILLATITERDADAGITLAWDGASTAKVFSVGGAVISNVDDPSADTDAANKGYVDAVAQGLHWKHPVLSISNTPPVSPVDGGHYATGDSPTGIWSGKAFNFANYTTAGGWTYEVAEEGDAFWNEGDNKQYVYNGSAWVTMGSTTIPDHNDTTNKQGGTTAEYYHLTNAQHSNLTGGAPTFATSVTTPQLYVDHITEKTSAHKVVVDVDLVASADLLVDEIIEKTADAGVLVEGVLLKDAILHTDDIVEKTADEGVTIEGILVKDATVNTTYLNVSVSATVDTINEYTADAGVTIEGVLLKDGDISAADITATSSVITDTISEYTSAAGVTIDGMKVKDSSPYTDTIYEKTSAAGVTVDGVLLKDATVFVDTISEKTSTAGVTIDGMLIKDSSPYTDHIYEKTADHGVDIDGVLCKDNDLQAADITATSSVITDTIAEYTTNTGVTIDGLLIKDSSPYADHIYEKTADHGVDVDGVLLKDGSGTAGSGGFFQADTYKANTDTDYDIAYDDTNNRWLFKGLKAGSATIMQWTWEIDANGDLMPYVA